MPVLSAGVLLWRPGERGPEVLLVHPGGPFHARRDAGDWSIPKGLPLPGEALTAAARREFAEETGHDPGDVELTPLGQARQKSGKVIHAFAARGDLDPAGLVSNEFELEWPPRSGGKRRFPEVDRGGWFGLDEARAKIHPGQAVFLDRLAALAPWLGPIPAPRPW